MASPRDTSSPLMLVTSALRRGLAFSSRIASTPEGASQGVEAVSASSVTAHRATPEKPGVLLAVIGLMVGNRPREAGAKASDQPAEAASRAADAMALKIAICNVRSFLSLEF